MDLSIEPRDRGTAVVHLTGRLDLLSAGLFRDRVTAAVAAGHQRLVIDLHDVSFVDSSGLGALIGGLKSTRVAGGDLRIARPTEQAAMILQLTNLNRVLVTHETVEEALASL